MVRYWYWVSQVSRVTHPICVMAPSPTGDVCSIWEPLSAARGDKTLFEEEVNPVLLPI